MPVMWQPTKNESAGRWISFPIWEGDPAFVQVIIFAPMPHADSALVPEGVKTRLQFWDHVHEQLVHLLADQRAWVCPFSLSLLSEPVTDVL